MRMCHIVSRGLPDCEIFFDIIQILCDYCIKNTIFEKDNY